MYAIVDIAGQQFKVEKQQKLFVHRLDSEAGAEVSFEKVLLIDNDGKVTVGTPEIKDAAVSAKVIDHVKGDKVLVFKKKRRKGYRKLNGHRQQFTQIEITDIKEKVAKKAEAKPAAEKKEAAPKAAASKKAPADKKPAAAKSTTDKKPAAKSTTAKKPAAKSTDAAKKPAAEKKPAADKKSDSSKSADKE